MSKSIKASSTNRFGEQRKKERFRKILDKYGIPSIRLGGYEYMVATNLMIYEELKKQTPKGKVSFKKQEPSMLDVS